MQNNIPCVLVAGFPFLPKRICLKTAAAHSMESFPMKVHEHECLEIWHVNKYHSVLYNIQQHFNISLPLRFNVDLNYSSGKIIWNLQLTEENTGGKTFLFYKSVFQITAFKSSLHFF